MSGSVTIPGAGASPITETFANQANLQLAKQIRDALVFASQNAGLTRTLAGSTTVPPPSNTTPGALNELIINKTGDYTIPAGAGGAPAYVVVIDDATVGGVTVHGALNTTIMGGNQNVRIIDQGTIALSEGASAAVVTINGAGNLLAGNNLNDTLTAAGVAGSISGGTGGNLFIDTGSNDTISAQGQKDTIRGGGGQLTVQIAANASRELVLGGGGALFVTDAAVGTGPAGDTIFGGKGSLDVTLFGNFARVVAGGGEINALDSGLFDTILAGGSATVTLAGSTAGSAGANNALVVGQGNLSVIDNGIGDTITAGLGFTSVTAATSSSFVQGGKGLLTFVGGTGNSIIQGVSSNATVFGGTGLTSITGGAGAVVTYVNTTAGALRFDAGTGPEIIDASLSKGSNTLFGGAGGHDLLIGGAGQDFLSASSGPDTLVGGGGANWFFLDKAAVGPGQTQTIADLSAIDNLMLIGYGPNAIASTVASGGSTTITLSDNTKITFSGMTDPAALNFHIGQA